MARLTRWFLIVNGWIACVTITIFVTLIEQNSELLLWVKKVPLLTNDFILRLQALNLADPFCNLLEIYFIEI